MKDVLNRVLLNFPEATASKGTIKRVGHIAEVFKSPSEIYLIVYGNEFPGPQRVSPVLEKALRGINGICMEMGLGAYDKNSREFTNFSQEQTNQTSFFTYAKEKNLTVFEADCSISDIKIADFEDGTFFAEGALGAGIAIDGIRRMVKVAKQKLPKSEGRRHIAIGISEIIAGAYLGLPLIGETGRIIASYTEGMEEITTNTQKFAHAAHPEMTLFTEKVRDLVLSQKMYFLHKMGYSRLVTPRGEAHVEIEDMLLSTEDQRLSSLEGIENGLSKFGKHLRDFVIAETFFQIVPFISNSQGNWRRENVLEEPHLKQILQYGKRT